MSTRCPTPLTPEELVHYYNQMTRFPNRKPRTLRSNARRMAKGKTCLRDEPEKER